MQFLQHDQLCPLLGGVSDACLDALDVGLDIRLASVLYDSYLHE